MRPRIRTIKPEMWQDERIGALTRDARVLLLGMVTLADDEGRFRARRSILVGHVLPADDDAFESVDGWVAEIREQGIVLFYVVDATPYGAFRHWRRHQKINKPTPSELPPPPDPKVLRDNRVPKKGAGSERDGSATGELSESDGSSHSPTRGRALRSDPIRIHSLCQRLANHIRRNDPKAAPNPQSDNWIREMRLLFAERNGDGDEVERIIDWSQTDDFWRSNILSPAKLRKQFTQLVLRAKANQVVPLHKPNPSAMLREVWAEELAEEPIDAEVVEESA